MLVVFALRYPGRTFFTKSCRFRRKVSEKLLLADCSDEFLQIEWFEVGYVLEIAGAQCSQGRGEHSGCLRVALAEVSVGVFDDIGAFSGSVTDE
jgi:hypothetical protein